MNTTPGFVCITGLPRAGSTLLCQLLAQHPDVDCDGHSSPLCLSLLSLRRQISDEPFFLSQLDGSFEQGYGRLIGAMRGFLRGWQNGSSKQIVVDKNRAWLQAVELLLHLEPEAKLIVCLRDLGQIYGSIEAQHQRTPALDFTDQLADLDRFSRAGTLFALDKTIGMPLNALHAVGELPRTVLEHLYFLRFEDLVAQPAAAMTRLYAWLGLVPFSIDPENLKTTAQESDSHYRMKYLHRQSTRVVAPRRHEIPPRIQAQIDAAGGWYTRQYYPR